VKNINRPCSLIFPAVVFVHRLSIPPDTLDATTLILNKKRELFAPFTSLFLPLFFLILEAIFTGYKPSLGFVPKPASAFACTYITSAVTTLFAILIFHNFLHSKYTILYIRCQEKLTYLTN
jgi:hypothetical protein